MTSRKDGTVLLDRLTLEFRCSGGMSAEKQEEYLSALDAPTLRKITQAAQRIIESRRALGGVVAVLEGESCQN